jgi:hypothetical protein
MDNGLNLWSSLTIHALICSYGRSVTGERSLVVWRVNVKLNTDIIGVNDHELDLQKELILNDFICDGKKS